VRAAVLVSPESTLTPPHTHTNTPTCAYPSFSSASSSRSVSIHSLLDWLASVVVVYWVHLGGCGEVFCVCSAEGLDLDFLSFALHTVNFPPPP
jgi:hypothetical protein